MPDIRNNPTYMANLLLGVPFLQHGQCLHCCSWKSLKSIWGYPKHSERCTKVFVNISSKHLVLCDDHHDMNLFLSGIRFIQLREDYKSAKLASRLSSLWVNSNWYVLKSELRPCKSRTFTSVKHSISCTS